MAKQYNPKAIEKKWQKYWEQKKTYRQYGRKKKFYVLDMFPYPSGAGLHVGHPKGYIATDVVARMKQLQGFAVLHPMGWDAFGLPAEQYAIKNKIHPSVAVKKNVATFKKQLEKIGFTYDWDREIDTTDPEYYKWTQWIFLQLFKKGLAYESYEPINWCPSCQTGLANEDLENGRCERCGSEVEKKPMRQWVLKMTAYADRLLYDLDKEKLAWEESIKEQQRNWIGRSEGAIVKFPVKESDGESIEVFTTRIDTIFSGTFLILAPEHPLIEQWASRISNIGEVREYVGSVRKKSEIERTAESGEKTGVELKGVTVVNPATGEDMPVWVSDFVLGHYGTGAVFADAHDERDFEFAQKYGIPLKTSIAPYVRLEGGAAPRSDEGVFRFKAVTGIVRHWSEEKYLAVEFVDGLWGLVGGAIHENESADEAMMRELEEETVYKNFSLEKRLFDPAISRGYKARKGREEECEEIVYVAKALNDGRSHEIAAEEGIRNYAWLTKDEILKKKMLSHHLFYFKHFAGGQQAFTEDGVLVNSGEFSGLTSREAREKITAWLEKKGLARRKVNYRLRDWVFSRQRYWGEPIPLVHCELCGVVPVPEKDLPVKLPNVKSYEPTGTGESPLAAIEKWVKTKCPACGGPARRETNTMPQWAGSSWYYLRYIDPRNKKNLVDLKKEKEWMPVDLYVGGAEHATRHLLYARFWHKFLCDIGAVSTKEPFYRLVNVGLILASDGRKMSKRWGNVINPDDMIAQFGADALRLYEMFMGPFTQSIAWNTDGVVGTRRFLEKVWRLQSRVESTTPKTDREKAVLILCHKTIKKVTEDIEGFRFNTAISTLMILVNEIEKLDVVPQAIYENVLILLSPFAPHIAEELWSALGHKESIFLESWPKANPKYLKDEEVELVVQVNGRLRGRVKVKAGSDQKAAETSALEDAGVKAHTDGKQIRKVIYVPDKLLNFVVS
jgi:leucyl-tRNA synthetase